jgi:hypothetical protein
MSSTPSSRPWGIGMDKYMYEVEMVRARVSDNVCRSSEEEDHIASGDGAPPTGRTWMDEVPEGYRALHVRYCTT